MSAVAWRAAAATAALAAALAAGADEAARAVAGGAWPYTVAPGDNLSAISARYGIDIDVIRRENGLPASGGLMAGATLRLDNRHIVPTPSAGDALVINVPQRMLFYFEDARLIFAFPVAVGQRGWATPLGAFTVLTKEVSPTWNVPMSIQEEMRRAGRHVETIVPPGPANPLGDHWLGLSLPGIGIHGTPQTTSIYRAATHGCIRVHPDDLSPLFARIRPGAAGRIIYRPVLVASVEADIFLEAHPDIYRRGDDDGGAALDALEEQGARIDWTAVARVLAARDGIARRVGGRETTD